MKLLSLFSLNKALLVIAFLLCLFVLFKNHTFAATLTSAKDTVTTSRPSPSSPNNDTLPGAAASSGELTVYNNGSRFLASDSAKVIRTTTTGIINQNLIVSSQSAGLTQVYLANTTSALTQNGTDVVYVPITAMHTIEFTTATALASGDDILISFPTLSVGDANNPASPSASTFQMNSLGTGTIRVWEDAVDLTAGATFTVTNPSAGTSPTVNISIGAAINAGSVVRIYLGCSAAAAATACDTQAPRIINPTKSSTAGNDDPYKIRIETQDSSASQAVLDNATVSVGIIESVIVRATVDPTLTFTITGINNNTAVNTGNTTGCLQTELTNSGLNSTSTEINLGTLANTPAADVSLGNIAAQRIDITTNAPTGYALTATSSSSLLNPTAGYHIPASTTPSSFPVQNAFFGLHACGQDVPTTYTESGVAGADCETKPTGSGGTTECRYAWPTSDSTPSTTPLSVASDNSGPIGSGSSDAVGDGSISVSYAAGTNVSVPPGEYRAIITYIATPSF